MRAPRGPVRVIMFTFIFVDTDSPFFANFLGTMACFACERSIFWIHILFEFWVTERALPRTLAEHHVKGKRDGFLEE